ncbi:MAG: hypothetical protein ACLQQ4_18020 [Bacteroidia bacterium]
MAKQTEKQRLDQKSTDRNPTSKPHKQALDNKSRQLDPKQQPLKPKK